MITFFLEVLTKTKYTLVYFKSIPVLGCVHEPKSLVSVFTNCSKDGIGREEGPDPKSGPISCLYPAIHDVERPRIVCYQSPLPLFSIHLVERVEGVLKADQWQSRAQSGSRRLFQS